MRIKFAICLMLICASVNAYSQSYAFFTDSPNSLYYEPSWGSVSGGSQLELVNTDKCPVETSQAYSGTNSLRLKWTSKSGGNWKIAITDEWSGHDITKIDTLSFYVYSSDGLAASSLPVIYLEDLSGNKTLQRLISKYTGDIPAKVWTKISIPASIFKSTTGSTDITKIKDVYFEQFPSDGVEHTLFVDEIRMTSNNSSLPPTPLNLKAKAYQRHIDISWDTVSAQGYNIYRIDSSKYKLIGSVSGTTNLYCDFVDTTGVSFAYRITAYNGSLAESQPTSDVTATTKNLTDDELLTMVQEASFRYFWNYGHPVSGLARERLSSGNTVTTGGSGFGVMAMLAGIERGFITRDEGAQRMLKILNFLAKADRFHGAWPHWLNGETGKVIPFSTYDDGGDLVETAFMVQGLLAARQYFKNDNDNEKNIRALITTLWESVEWDWYRQTSTSSYLYWHWSPNYAWQINMKIQGWDEAQIVYLLAIASPTHAIPASCYKNGWAGSSSYRNGNSFYGIPLYLGSNYGGPLFFAHYSFLGFDPRNKKDSYTNYFNQNKNHTLINRAYCIANPQMFPGYGANCWGLTASDDPFGYLAHEPTSNNDNGTISPTAALSSMPYTPTESIAALKEFYNVYGKNLWGVYGFKDAFNVWKSWYAGSYLAIDQGPIVVMIENYRSQLLWNNFMANSEIKPMLDSVGFVADITDVNDNKTAKVNAYSLMNNYPNPFNPSTIIAYSVPSKSRVVLKIYDMLGKEISLLVNEEKAAGNYKISFDGSKLASGVYFYKLEAGSYMNVKKMILLK